MRVLDYFSVALYTTVNIVRNGATLGRDVGSKGGSTGVSSRTGPGAFGTPQEVRRANHRAGDRRANKGREVREGSPGGTPTELSRPAAASRGDHERRQVLALR